MKLVFILAVSVLGAVHAGTPQGPRGYPADLFALVAPGAITITNAHGYTLLAGGRMIEARRRDTSWIFTDTRTREILAAHQNSAGWQITRGKQVGRIHTTISGAIMDIGTERRTTTATRDGYVTTTNASNSAEAFFEHLYRRK